MKITQQLYDVKVNSDIHQNRLIEVNDLTVEFRTRIGNIKAVNGVSLSLNEAETLCILGESGSGKSVTSLAIMGLLPKPAGRIINGQVLFRGQNLVTLSEKELRKLRGSRISMISQDPLSALNPVLTVGYQIGEVLRRHKHMSLREAKKSAVELMERVRIPDAKGRVNHYPHQFSGGMRQRVIIAMALALGPEVLIADEPTTALDVTVQAQIMRLLKELQRTEKMGLILITHDLGVVADVADRVAIMYSGRVVETGKIQEVFQRPAHPYTLGLMDSVPAITNRKSRLTPIKGSPPSLHALPTGCTFRPRCPFASERCKQEEPVLQEVLPGRESACHFTKEVLLCRR